MLNILLIDADSTIPNLAIMKLASYYKQYGTVELKKLNIPYYPNKIKSLHIIDTSKYDFSFCSVIFEGSINYIKGDNIIYGGTGLQEPVYLPLEIDNCEPDYSIYDKYFTNDTSYGFLSRGCIRKCSFCKVNKFEGELVRYRNVDDIVRHNKVKFMDNNFLALPEHSEILKELISKNIKCQFNQGLDIRLVDDENSTLLSKLNYLGEYIFAFDNIKLKDLIIKKLNILSWRRDWQFKFFVYINPSMSTSETKERILFLKENKILPYIMRDISCYSSENKDFYTDIAAWCNQVFAFKKLSFEEFLPKRTNNSKRIEESLKVWNQC